MTDLTHGEKKAPDGTEMETEPGSDLAAKAAQGQLPLKEFLERSKDAPEEIERLGTAFYEEGRLAEAGTLFRALVEMNSESGCYRNALGAVLLARGEHEEALEHLQKAVEKDPGNIDALVNRAEANIACRKYDDAHRDIEAAIELDPGKQNPAANRARKLAWGMAELDRAIKPE